MTFPLSVCFFVIFFEPFKLWSAERTFNKFILEYSSASLPYETKSYQAFNVKRTRAMETAQKQEGLWETEKVNKEGESVWRFGKVV